MPKSEKTMEKSIKNAVKITSASANNLAVIVSLIGGYTHC